MCFVVLRGKPQGNLKICFMPGNKPKREQRWNKTTVLSYGHIRSKGGTN